MRGASMNRKSIFIISIVATLASVMCCVTLMSDSSDAADSTLSADTAAVGQLYERRIGIGPRLEQATVTGASWLTASSYISGGNLGVILVKGTPVANGTYNIVVTLNDSGDKYLWTCVVGGTPGNLCTVKVYDHGTIIRNSSVYSDTVFNLPVMANTTSEVFKGFALSPTGNVIVGSGGTYVVTSDIDFYALWAPRMDVLTDDTAKVGQLYTRTFRVGPIDPATVPVITGASWLTGSCSFLGGMTACEVRGTPTAAGVNNIVVNMGTTGITVKWNCTVSLDGGGDLSFLTNTNSVIGVSGNSYTYVPKVNITSAQIALTQSASWLNFSGGTLSGTFPNVSEPTTYKIVLTATASNPDQTATQSITFFVYPKLSLSGDMVLGYKMGDAFDYTISANLPNCTYSMTGTSILSISANHIVGAFPVRSDPYNETITLTVVHTASNQSVVKSYTLNVIKNLEFTTKPTSSFVYSPTASSTPQYTSFIIEYLDGIFGSFSSAAGEGEMPRISASVVRFTFTGTNAETVKWVIDGKPVSEENVFVHEFRSGVHKITCIAENSLGKVEYSTKIKVVSEFNGLTVVDFLIIGVGLLSIVFVVVARRNNIRVAGIRFRRR